MSRESKRRQRIARRQEYRAKSNGRVLATSSSEHEAERRSARLVKHVQAMPGPPEEKYVVLLNCGDRQYRYPIYRCQDGFTAALQDAIGKHQRAGRPVVKGGTVYGVGDAILTPPDALVQAIAAGAKVLVTNRLQNAPLTPGGLYGYIGMGSDKALDNASNEEDGNVY